MLGVYQTYGTNCDRQNNINPNLIMEKELWKQFLPHSQFSGICYSYTPTSRSKPGECYSLRIAFGPSDTNNWVVEQMEQTNIFLHTAGQFQYYLEDDMPNNHKVDNQALKEGEETTLKLEKSFFTALDKPEKDQPCTAGEDYIWPECLDGLIYRSRGCQDPWNHYPTIPIPYCANTSKILEDYSKGRSGCGITCWDKPYMSQRSLAETSRQGKTCPLPCSKEIYTPHFSYKQKKL